MRKGQLEQQILLLVTLALVAFGLVMVYSATSASAALASGDSSYYLRKQGLYALVGLALLLVLRRSGYRSLRFLSPALVLTSVGLLLAVLVVGQTVNGARRWLNSAPQSSSPRSWRSSPCWSSPPRTSRGGRHRAPSESSSSP